MPSSESGGRVTLSFLEIKVLTFVFEPPETVNIYAPLYVGVAHAKSGTERDRQYKSHEVCEQQHLCRVGAPYRFIDFRFDLTEDEETGLVGSWYGVWGCGIGGCCRVSRVSCCN